MKRERERVRHREIHKREGNWLKTNLTFVVYLEKIIEKNLVHDDVMLVEINYTLIPLEYIEK
jgi:hypothetical protein